MFNSQLARIRALMEEVGQKTERWRLDSCATLEQIAEFETQIGFSLPDEYKQFLLQVADGFLAGGLGALSLFEGNGSFYSSRMHPLVAFPLRHTPEQWNGLWSLIRWNELSGHEKMESDVALYFAARSGPRPLLLVLSGAGRGCVWHSFDWAVSELNAADEFDGLPLLDCLEEILKADLARLDSSSAS